MAGDASPTPAAAQPATLHFGDFRLEPGNARLTHGSRRIELAPKAFSVLCHLAARPGQLVTKDELLDAVWGRRFVSESVLKTAVNAIRAALDDDPRQPTFIETVSRRGYRFLLAQATVRSPGEDAASPSTSTSTSPSSSSSASAAAFVGRDAALAQLCACRDLASGGQRQLVLVGGEAGIGKSTLLREFADQVPAGGIVVAFGQCVEQAGGGEPYLPILDALSELARGPLGERWLGALSQAAPTWLAQMPWLSRDEGPAHRVRELAGSGQERMLREFGALLDVATASNPLLLVLEDMHWSDHASVSLLDYLARRRGAGRWMLVASYRATELALAKHPLQALRQELRVHKLCAEVVLEPFSEAEVGMYLHRRLGPQSTPHRVGLARALHAHTEGLPLFLANVLDDIESDATISLVGGLWSDPAHALGELHLPETVVGVVERQIDRLPGDLRDLLEAASVLGFEFAHPLLARLLGQEANDLATRCDGLVRRAEWLRPAGITALPDGSLSGRYAFRHALYRRVFHERLAPARRIHLHLRAADLLQATPLLHGHQVAVELAQHYEAARDTAAASGLALPKAARGAITWRLRAARAAVAMHAPVDALAHFARAEKAGAAAGERVRMLGDCADLHQQLGAGAKALSASTTALVEARAAGDASLWQEAMVRCAQIAQQNDFQVEAVAFVDELLANAEPVPATRLATALGVKADALDALGRPREADEAAQQALAALPDDADAARARHAAGRVAAHFQRGEFTRGLAVIDAALVLYERLGDAVGAATMLNRRGVFQLKLGRPQDAEATLLDSRERSRAVHDVQGQRSCILNLVKLLTDRGDAERALILLDEGSTLAAGFESRVTECAFLSGFFYCNYLRGDLGAALQDADRVLTSAATLSSVYWRVGSLILVSDLYIHLSALDRAAELIGEAVHQTETRQAPHLWPRVALHRAWLDVLAGDAKGALARLDDIGSAGAPVQDEDLASIARVRAEAWFALGDPRAVIEALASFDGAPTQEVWALMLALRLRAQIQLGSVAAADVARAHTELADVRLPALESLVLRRALAAAIALGGDATVAAEETAHVVAQRERLLASLAGSEMPASVYLGTGSALHA